MGIIVGYIVAEQKLKVGHPSFGLWLQCYAQKDGHLDCPRHGKAIHALHVASTAALLESLLCLILERICSSVSIGFLNLTKHHWLFHMIRFSSPTSNTVCSSHSICMVHSI